MKRLTVCLLLLCLLPLAGAFSACAEEETAALPALYSGRMRLAAKAFRSWDGTEGIDQVGVIPEGAWVIIHGYNPTFALVTCTQEGVTGYVKRVCIEQIKIRDGQNIPPFGVEFQHYIASVAAQDAPVTSAPGGGETLITLHQGAKIAFIGFEAGYAKLIYHRQYGYIDSRLITEAVNVYYDPETASDDAPIAAYTSFYKVTTDESNLGRMENIAVACAKLSVMSFQTGDAFNFNAQLGPYNAANGYKKATVLTNEVSTQGYGGGTCQVSSTLYNVVLQLPGLTVLQRRAHGNNGASYLPTHMDAAVGNSTLNFRFRNDYGFPVRIDASSQDGALTIAIYRVRE